MRSGERLALAIVCGLFVLVGGTTCAAAYAWHRAGTMRVAIHEAGGRDLSLQLPGLIVDAAIALCPLPSDAEFEARLRGISPALRAVSSRLATMDDAVLVDAKSDEDTVRVEKRGNEILIRVVSAAERLDIAIPLESVERLANKLDLGRT